MSLESFDQENYWADVQRESGVNRWSDVDREGRSPHDLSLQRIVEPLGRVVAGGMIVGLSFFGGGCVSTDQVSRAECDAGAAGFWGNALSSTISQQYGPLAGAAISSTYADAQREATERVARLRVEQNQIEGEQSMARENKNALPERIYSREEKAFAFVCEDIDRTDSPCSYKGVRLDSPVYWEAHTPFFVVLVDSFNSPHEVRLGWKRQDGSVEEAEKYGPYGETTGAKASLSEYPNPPAGDYTCVWQIFQKGKEVERKEIRIIIE